MSRPVTRSKTRANNKQWPKKKKKKTPTEIRRRNLKQVFHAQTQAFYQQNNALPENSTSVHIMSNADMTNMKKKGVHVIVLTKPVRTTVNKDKIIYWEIDRTLSTRVNLGNGNVCENSVAIVTTYDQLKNDHRIIFVGAFEGSIPAPKDWVLLCLVDQSPPRLPKGQMNTSYNVACEKKRCKKAKPNIVDGKSSKHHKSRGSIHGFGARKETDIDILNGSSVRKYKINDNEKDLNESLEKRLIGTMEFAKQKIKIMAGHDLILENSINLKAAEAQVKLQGLNDDFSLLGNTGYSSLYYNFDASTMDKHTEMDWCMTTIYVPHQDWQNKDNRHLNFLFHLTGKEDTVLKIGMKPGTAIYFHGYLLMHQQMHDEGKTTACGCCLNFSAYANQRLRSHLNTSLNRANEINED